MQNRNNIDYRSLLLFGKEKPSLDLKRNSPDSSPVKTQLLFIKSKQEKEEFKILPSKNIKKLDEKKNPLIK